MRAEMVVMLRGEPRQLVWDDGALSGDAEVIRRLHHRAPHHRALDLVGTIREIEAATAQRVVFTLLEEDSSPNAVR